MLATLANHLWQSTLFAAIAALLALALRGNGAHVRYWLWMTASLKFLLPFSVLVALGGQFAWHAELVASDSLVRTLATPAQWADFAGTMVQPAGGYLGTPAIETGIENFRSTWSLELIAFVIWAVGFVGVIGFWTNRWLQLRALLRTAESHAVELPSLKTFPVPVRCVRSQIEPGIVGVLNPVLLFPRGLLERLTRQQLQAILAHERCHLDRRDNLTAAIHMLVEAMFWFHPFVWWIGSRLVEERERACDAAVLKAGNDPESYAEGILDVCQHYVAAPLDCVAGVSGADLKKRVRSIMTHTGESRLHFIKLTLLATVAVLMVGSPIVIGAFTTSRAEAWGLDNAPAIESVSISLGQTENPLGFGLLINPNGNFTTRNWTLRGIIAFAYGLQESEIVERSAAASDLASSRYNILAKAVTEPGKSVSKEEFQLLARRLLAEQYQLQFHWDTKRVPVYALLPGPSGALLKAAKPGDPGPLMSHGEHSITCSSCPMLLLKQYLSTQFERPIVDQTGLTGQYNFVLSWAPEKSDAGNSAEAAPPKEPPREVVLKLMEEQLGLNLVSQDGDVRQLVVDRLTQPANLKLPPRETAVDAKILDRYVGYYDFPPARIVSIVRQGEHLRALMTAAPSIQLYATGEHSFFNKEVEAALTFVIGDGGRPTQLNLTMSGKSYQLPQLDAAVAIQRQEYLDKRIRERIAQAGTEEGLSKHLEGLRLDRPVYELMTKDVQEGVRISWAATKPRYPTLGALKSIEFKSVGPAGADIYLATYEHASSEWRVHVNEEGKMDILTYRRVSTQ